MLGEVSAREATITEARFQPSPDSSVAAGEGAAERGFAA